MKGFNMADKTINKPEMPKATEKVLTADEKKMSESKLVEDGKLAKVYHHPKFGYFKVLK
jgi:hypothetical protein